MSRYSKPFLGAVYQKPVATVYSCAAFDVVALDTDRDGLINIIHGDQLAAAYQTRTHGTLYHTYTAGSAVGYALEYNDDPIAAHNRCLERGDLTHWINQNAVCISASPQERRAYINVIPGETLVRFEGRKFLVAPAPNDNLSLIPLTEKAVSQS